MNCNTTKRVFICSVILCAVTAAPARHTAAQDAATRESGVLGLHEAIDQTIRNSNKYRTAREKMNESKYRVREAWGKLWPDLSTDISETRYGADKGIMSLSYGSDDIRFIKGTLAINPGNFYETLRSSREDYTMAMNDERSIKLDATLQAIRLYYKILWASEMVQMRNNSVKALEENLRVVTLGYKVGSFTRLDYLRVKVAMANEKTRLINAQNEYQSAKSALNIQMGREIDSPLEIDRNSIIVDAGRTSEIVGWDEEKRSSLLSAMTAEALQNRPELLRIISKKESLSHGARAAESIYLWPTLFVSGSYGMNKVIPKSSSQSTGDRSADIALYDIGQVLEPSGWNKNWTVTFGATYRWGSLFPFDQSHARADQLRSKALQSDYEMNEFLRSVRLDVQLGLLKLISSSNAILSQEENIESADESLRVAMLQLKNGTIDNTKFLESVVELSNAKTLYIQALYDLQSSKAEVNRAIGTEYLGF
jgi:outer membrane protein